LMDNLKQSGGFTVAKEPFDFIADKFDAGRSDETETAHVIEATLKKSGYLLDPHSAVGLKVAREHECPSVPMVTLATAHPAKFPDAVKAACGVYPQLPKWQGDLMQREEHFTLIANNENDLKSHIRNCLLGKGKPEA